MYPALIFSVSTGLSLNRCGYMKLSFRQWISYGLLIWHLFEFAHISR